MGYVGNSNETPSKTLHSQSNQPMLIFGTTNNANPQPIQIPALPPPSFRATIEALPQTSGNYYTSPLMDTSYNFQTGYDQAFPPTYSNHDNRYLFPVDLNAKIDEEIFKDEEEEFFALNSQQQYQRELQYHQYAQKQQQQQESYQNPPQQYTQSNNYTASFYQDVYQSHPPQVQNPNYINYNASHNSHSTSLTSNEPAPYPSLDEDFVIGAVALASTSPNQLQYTHQTISPNQSNVATNLHRSNAKRKNQEISTSDTKTTTTNMTTTTKIAQTSLPSTIYPGATSRQSIADNLMNATASTNIKPSSSSTNITPSPSTSSKQSKETATQYQFLLDFPVMLFQAFNGGDFQKVKEIILAHTSADCSLKTPALDEELHGQNYVVELFEAFGEAHPDAVWVAKKCKLHPENLSAGQLPELQGRIYFAGTRIFKPQLMTQFTDVTFESPSSDYLYKRPNSSLLDEMENKGASIQELSAMKELETRGKNLSIFGKGSIELGINEMKKINRFRVHWTITSFREAEL